MPEQVEVNDEVEHHRFVVDGGAELVYRVQGDKLLLIHTRVPDELGGRGIGGALVEAAVARGVRDGLTLVPHCPYAASWLRKHPDAAATVAVEWPEAPDDADDGDRRGTDGAPDA